MFNLKTKLAAGFAAVTFASQSMAASLLSTEMVTSMDTGFTDLQDTVVDVVANGLPYVLGIIGILVAPKIIKRLISIA